MLIDSCHLCHKILWRLHDSLCVKCQESFLQSDLIYRELTDKNGEILPVVSLFQYIGEAGRLVRSLKGGNLKNLTAVLTECLAQKVSPQLFEHVGCVIPVPAQNWGELDHAARIGRHLANYFRAPYFDQHLERKGFEAQKLKPLEARQSVEIHMRTAFSGGTIAGSKERHQSGVLLLVDDVITTGSTLLQAWHALGRPRALGVTLSSTPRLVENMPKIW
ncbi:MAG: hypothetical protein SGI74_06810 [Oligoflexia bacterium]|nr:hypothetical protein [Oligoflexia bacterium]